MTELVVLFTHWPICAVLA